MDKLSNDSASATCLDQQAYSLVEEFDGSELDISKYTLEKMGEGYLITINQNIIYVWNTRTGILPFTFKISKNNEGTLSINLITYPEKTSLN
ncbi:hypothetical protein COU58_01345 [Candidatus Pacearchaeota archaeon CG10_big_fil_rev_8_21_14_0_10_32_42]|nr:MAG: hypothetical protein COU58_01345 [Candidatus Pacearchaeota archaeon CG10_big_fil_rev_8_21_14_0_10_32_42]